MNPLALRKQLLIAESELNRAQLAQEWQTMGRGVRDLAQGAKAISAWASAVALLVSEWVAFRHRKVTPAEARPSWFKRLLYGAQFAYSIWLAFRTRPK